MKLGFAGLGQMGRPIALNLLKSGAELIVSGRSDRVFGEFLTRGGRATLQVADLAEADIVFLCLPNAEIVREVMLGEGGLLAKLRPGQAVVDLSTITYTAAVEIARAAEMKGVGF